jgi:hypothetical protein
MSQQRRQQPRGSSRLTEVSVAGPLGPVLRTAFTDRRITTRSEFTVIRTGPASDRDLTELVRTLVERGLVVESVHRLTDGSLQGEEPESHQQWY